MVELYDPVDPASVMGLPAESHCRLCGAAWRAVVYPGPANTTGALAYRGGGLCPGCGLTLDDASLDAHSCTRCGCHARRETVSRGADLRDRATLDAALARFASEEQDPDVPAFVEHNFAAGSVDAVHALLAAGAPVETSFDAGFALFHGGRAGSSGGARGAGPETTAARPAATPNGYDPRAMVLALVSVLVADGKRDPREMAFMDRFLAAESMAPLAPEEVKVHRPVEVAARIPPTRREGLIELMVQLACVDGEADPSEQRLVQSYAGHWGVDAARVEGWFAQYQGRYATDLQRLFARLRAFFLAPQHDRT